jgi:hypothetical protein
MNCLVEFTDGAFWNTPLQPDQWGHASDISLSWRERNHRTAAIIQSNPAAPTPPSRSRGKDDPASCRNKLQGSSTQSPPQTQSDPKKRAATTAARHGSYVSAPPRKSSDPRGSATSTAPLPLRAAYRTRPLPQDRRFISSPLHASFALCRLAGWAGGCDG